jgi:AraC-like DNA-binding protein
LALIKETPSITKVEHLVELSDVPLRAFQRSFQNYLGMSPKWLIRKYRLHHALKALEDKTLTSADLVAMLDYTDQSHLIRDFKQFLGKTPSIYIKDDQ